MDAKRVREGFDGLPDRSRVRMRLEFGNGVLCDLAELGELHLGEPASLPEGA